MSSPDRPINPLFEVVADTDPIAAQAFSEPMERPPGTFAVHTIDDTFPFRQAKLVAMGVTIIDADPAYGPDETTGLDEYFDRDAVTVRDAYYFAPELANPYQSFRSFVDGYKGLVHPAQRVGRKLVRQLDTRYGKGEGDASLSEYADRTIDVTMQKGLIALSSFAVFANGEQASGRHAGALIIPEVTVTLAKQCFDETREALATSSDESMVTDVRAMAQAIEPTLSSSDIEDRLWRVLNGDPAYPPQLATFMGALSMPGAEAAEGNLGSDPRLSHYMGKTRKEIKAILRQEEKERRRRG